MHVGVWSYCGPTWQTIPPAQSLNDLLASSALEVIGIYLDVDEDVALGLGFSFLICSRTSLAPLGAVAVKLIRHRPQITFWMLAAHMEVRLMCSRASSGLLKTDTSTVAG